ncbi:amino acid permease [Kitasatospora sp. NPDC049258]|uniref:amino acid permease n=1 Tax=Kitasatospora sp. NPDC049258 TaxID=3155394 RepID=UPI00342BDBE6
MCAMDLPADGPGTRTEVKDRAVPAVSAPRPTWLTLALMTTSSVASLRAAPTMAVHGLACVLRSIVPAVVFLLPTALVSAELASGWEGGVSNWVSQGLSKPMGFLTVWCQFAMTVFHCPSLLAYVASTIGYVIDPAPPGNGLCTAIVIMVLHWTGGLLASAAAMVIGFVPSSQLGSSVWSYVLLFGSGLLLLGVIIPSCFLKFRKPGWRMAGVADDARPATGGAA